MSYKESIFDLIKRRTSWRNYDSKALDDNLIQEISDFTVKNNIGPFQNKSRFTIMEVSKDNSAELKKFGTYGVIKGARYFLIGVVERGLNDAVDFGYCFEKSVLFATEMGLATCWLGGTFNRGSFAQKMQLSSNETMPAITPIGYPMQKRNFIDKTMRTLAGSHKRKEWGELFFEKSFDKKLKFKKPSDIADILEMVRIAPSASNKQPWRVVYDGDSSFHFYMERSKILKMYSNNADLQKIDIGIAMSHFDLCAREIGVKGSWRAKDPKIENSAKYEYIASWV